MTTGVPHHQALDHAIQALDQAALALLILRSGSPAPWVEKVYAALIEGRAEVQAISREDVADEDASRLWNQFKPWKAQA
jgi:hypothetical protein